MKVLFLYPNLRGMSLVPPVIAVFTSILKQSGHQVDLFDTTNYNIPGFADPNRPRELNLFFPENEVKERKKADVFQDFCDKVNFFNPDLIAVTVTESTFLTAITILRYFNSIYPKHGVPVIFGGVFPTFAPQRAIEFPEVDMICVGEGESAIIDLCDCMNAGKSFDQVTNLWLKKASGEIVKNSITRPVNIDNLPPPDYSLFAEERFYRALGDDNRLWRMLPVETHRGCPFTCAFCNSPSQNRLYDPLFFKGRTSLKIYEDSGKDSAQFFRKKSIVEIRKEIFSLIDRYGMNYIFFWADTFLAWSFKELEAFCEMYKEFKLPFWCQTRPETIHPTRNGYKKLEILQQVGLHWISFGLEQGNEEFRRNVVDRPYSNLLLVEAMQVPKDVGIPFTVNNIIGFPDETRKLAFETIDINQKINPNTLSCSIFTPYYGTVLRDMAVAKGYMDPNLICPSNSEDTVLRMPQFLPAEIKGLSRTFVMYVKFGKERWPEIELAEQLTEEGDRVWAALRQEYQETFFRKPEHRIDKINSDDHLPDIGF